MVLFGYDIQRSTEGGRRVRAGMERPWRREAGHPGVLDRVPQQDIRNPEP